MVFSLKFWFFFVTPKLFLLQAAPPQVFLSSTIQKFCQVNGLALIHTAVSSCPESRPKFAQPFSVTAFSVLEWSRVTDGKGKVIAVLTRPYSATTAGLKDFRRG